jgi:hypothetical protein
MKATHRIILIGLLSALLVVVQVALAPIPNVELVSFLFLMYAITLPLSMSLSIAIVFATLQMLVWGMGDWVIGYYWIWAFWVILVYVLKRLNLTNEYRWALLSGLWGFLFGILFAVNHGVLYGLNYSIAYWVKGVSFDIIHAISNYIVILVLFVPTHKLFERLVNTFKGNHYESNH